MHLNCRSGHNEMSLGTLIWLQRAFDYSLFAPARIDTLDPHIVCVDWIQERYMGFDRLSIFLCTLLLLIHS